MTIPSATWTRCWVRSWPNSRHAVSDRLPFSWRQAHHGWQDGANHTFRGWYRHMSTNRLCPPSGASKSPRTQQNRLAWPPSFWGWEVSWLQLHYINTSNRSNRWDILGWYFLDTASSSSVIWQTNLSNLCFSWWIRVTVRLLHSSVPESPSPATTLQFRLAASLRCWSLTQVLDHLLKHVLHIEHASLQYCHIRSSIFVLRWDHFEIRPVLDLFLLLLYRGMSFSALCVTFGGRAFGLASDFGYPASVALPVPVVAVLPRLVRGMLCWLFSASWIFFST